MSSKLIKQVCLAKKEGDTCEGGILGMFGKCEKGLTCADDEGVNGGGRCWTIQS